MAEQGLTFIHLSDIHFHKNSGDNYDLDYDLRNEIIEDIKREVNALGSVSGILISGDIAFSGKQVEYKSAERFLFELCQLLQIPKTSIYCVPGNHDVDQDVIKESHSLERAQSGIETSKKLDSEIAGYMRDPNSKTMMYSHIHEYNNFSAKFNCNIDADRQTWKNDLKLNDGSLLRLYGLNSVIISSHRDNPERAKEISSKANKKYRENNREKFYKSIMNNYFKNKFKWRSRSELYRLIKNKTIKIDNFCKKCQSQNDLRLKFEEYPNKVKEIRKQINKKIYYLCGGCR